MWSFTNAVFGDTRWAVGLDVPPIVVNAGLSTHGQAGDESYLLPSLWSFHLYPYDAKLTLDTGTYAIRYGSVSIVPPNVPIYYHYDHIGEHFFAHITFATKFESREPQTMPIMLDVGANFDSLYDDIITVAGTGPVSSYRLRARLWDILCRITAECKPETTPRNTPDLHPIVRRAQMIIDRNLDKHLSVQALAQEVNASPGYLVKLFRNQCGTTVVESIRQRRLERAAYLIGNTTMPIKSIAAICGIANLQQFNKAIRLGFGRSPRDLRDHVQVAASFAEPTRMYWEDRHDLPEGKKSS